MTAFVERLRRAARVAGVGDSQSAIADSLGLNRQTVYRWWKGGQPNAEITLQIAAKWGVSAEWLKFGVGDMAPQPPAALSPDERQLIQDYRSATPSVRQVIASMTRAARKSVVTLAAVIPPLLAPADGEAGILHIPNYLTLSPSLLHIGRRWLARLCVSAQLLSRGWTIPNRIVSIVSI